MEKQLKDTLNFIIENSTNDNIRKSNILSIVDEYITYKKKVKEKNSYQINPIEELRANENANSRILCSLLRYKVNGEYNILKSFLAHFFPEVTFNVHADLIIESEQYRIDLSVRDKKGGYALIFENKIHDATLQRNQLARYIRKLNTEEGFKDEQIYVIFLPSSSYYEPNDCCWYEPDEKCNSCKGDCLLKDQEPQLRKKYEEEGRYLKITFREDILNWLKGEVLPNLLYKETLLQATVLLYIDYLEGLFNLRTMDQDKNKEFIIQKLNLDNCQTIDIIRIMNEYDERINHLKNEIDGFQSCIIKLKEEEVDKELKKIEELKDLTPKFNGIELWMKYKNFHPCIGVYNGKIYYSIKTEQDFSGKASLQEKQLDIFSREPDKYNSYGWEQTDRKIWKDQYDFLTLRNSDKELWTEVCEWIEKMKNAIDKLETGYQV